MRRKGPTDELRVLRQFVGEAEAKFLAQHLGPAPLGTASRDEELDVAAFVVLTHGALENFVEGIGLWVLESIEKSWVPTKRATRSLASLLLYADAPAEDWEESVTVFDNIRMRIAEEKTATSGKIEQNNGIATRHLRSIFRPLGIDIPTDPTLTGSLELLISIRHQWAHQYRFGAKVTRFAVDVKKTSDDCLALAAQLAAAARTARP